MLSIGFILPPTTNYKPFRQVPLTSLYLFTILEQEFKDKISLDIIDLRGISEENMKFYIPEKDIYLYTVMSPEWKDILNVLNLVKSIYPKAKHVAGGIHINLFPDQAQQYFDAISLGKGEETIVQITKDMMASSLKKVYNANVHDMKYRIAGINKYPFPLRKFIPHPAIVQTGVLTTPYKNLLGTGVHLSRGCPFHCTFCCNEVRGITAFRSPENIEAELNYLKKEYKIEALSLIDDNSIPVNKKVAPQFLGALGKANLKWRGQCRANGISEDMVKLAAESGCTDLALGIESVSPKVLKIIRKQIDLNEAKKFIELLKKYNIGPRLLLIFGLPGETEKTAADTLKFVEEIQPASVVFSLFSPYPGSRMSMYPEEFGMKIYDYDPTDLRNYSGRLDASEKAKMLYEYKENTPWGKSMNNETILKQYEELQNIFRDKGLNF